MSKEPIRIDLLIIKEENADKVMKNEIGHIMRKYNVLEPEFATCSKIK